MRITFALSLALAACSAQAGRPLQSEDAPVIDEHACEVEGAYTDWRTGGDDTPQTYLQLACGVFVVHEKAAGSEWAGFGIVWIALVVLTWDGLRQAARVAAPQPAVVTPAAAAGS